MSSLINELSSSTNITIDKPISKSVNAERTVSKLLDANTTVNDKYINRSMDTNTIVNYKEMIKMYENILKRIDALEEEIQSKDELIVDTITDVIYKWHSQNNNSFDKSKDNSFIKPTKDTKESKPVKDISMDKRVINKDKSLNKYIKTIGECNDNTIKDTEENEDRVIDKSNKDKTNKENDNKRTNNKSIDNPIKEIKDKDKTNKENDNKGIKDKTAD